MFSEILEKFNLLEFLKPIKSYIKVVKWSSSIYKTHQEVYNINLIKYSQGEISDKLIRIVAFMGIVHVSYQVFYLLVLKQIWRIVKLLVVVFVVI